MIETLVLEPEVAMFKAAEAVATGLRTLEFYAAAFSKTPDANGDVIDPHAFDEWLQRFYKAGKPLPISFSHAAVLDSLDPTNVIGYAPADPGHVWVDDYGLRVSGFFDTSSEKGKAVEWQILNQLIGAASMAYLVSKDGRVKDGDWMRITSIADVREVGPTPNPANQEAVLLWMKSEHLLEEAAEVPYMTVEEFRETFKALDGSAWDANTAMGACDTAADYRSICAGERSEGDPAERQHWALPHHYLGKDANAAGVAAARARLNQTQGLKNASAARTHLFETHSLPSDQNNTSADTSSVISTTVTDEGFQSLYGLEVALKHAASPTYIQAAHDALVRGGAKCASAGEETASEEVPVTASDPDADRLRRLRFMKTSIIR